MTPYNLLNELLMKSKFEIDVERDDEGKTKWLKVNPYLGKPVQVADIRPYTHEEKEETPLVEFKMPELHEKLKEAIDEHYASLNARRYRQDPDIMDAAIYGKFAIDKVKEEKMTNSYIEEKIKYVERKLLPFVSMNDMSMTLLYDSLCDSFSLSVRKGKIGREYRIDKAGAYKKEYFVDEFVKMIERDFVIINRPSYPSVPSIKNVIFNDPATIVFWDDNTKTVVKAQDEAYDPEKGMAMAISKKALGNQGNYCNIFKKWLPEEVEEKEMTITDAMAAISEFAKHFNLGEVNFGLVPKKEGDE